MSLALNVGSWWEYSGEEHWATNLRQSNFIANVIAAVGTKLKLRYGNLMLASNDTYLLAKSRIRVFYIFIYSVWTRCHLNFRLLVLFKTE